MAARPCGRHRCCNAVTKSLVLDVRLTAEDGYPAQHGYSLASPPEDRQITLTVERLDNGEVSP